MAYKTLVRPLVEYSASVWSPYTQNNIHRIEMVQHRAARWTLDNYTIQASVSEMLTHLGCRPLEQRRNDSRLCLFNKIIHGLVAVDLPPLTSNHDFTKELAPICLSPDPYRSGLL